MMEIFNMLSEDALESLFSAYAIGTLELSLATKQEKLSYQDNKSRQNG